MAQQIPPTRGPGRGPGRPRGRGSGPDPIDSGGENPPPADGYAGAPFAWQHGSQVLLLEARPTAWVLAELRFDPSACHYVEIRRARYRWAREAACALLGRALAAGEAGTARAARDLQTWLDGQRTGGKA